MHCVAGVWFATACTNKALVRKGEDVCEKKSWAKHQGKRSCYVPCQVPNSKILCRY